MTPNKVSSCCGAEMINGSWCVKCQRQCTPVEAKKEGGPTWEVVRDETMKPGNWEYNPETNIMRSNSPKPPEDREGGEGKCTGSCGETIPPEIAKHGGKYRESGRTVFHHPNGTCHHEGNLLEHSCLAAPRPTEGWEERFEKERIERDVIGQVYAVSPWVKSFIAAEIERAVAEHDAKWHPINDKFQMENEHIRADALASYRAELREKIEKLDLSKIDDDSTTQLKAIILSLLSPNEDKLKPRE